jgi:hypothetical protein
VETILEINFLSQDFSPERHFWEPNMRIHMYIKALFCLNDDSSYCYEIKFLLLDNQWTIGTVFKLLSWWKLSLRWNFFDVISYWKITSLEWLCFFHIPDNRHWMVQEIRYKGSGVLGTYRIMDIILSLQLQCMKKVHKWST